MKKNVQQTMTIKNTTVTVTKKKVNNLNLSVHAPEGAVKLSVPQGMGNDDIRAFLAVKLPWIHRQQDNIKQRSDAMNSKPLSYATGEHHYVAGKPYALQVIETVEGKQGVTMVAGDDQGELVMQVKPGNTQEDRKKVMSAFYRAYLKETIPGITDKWEPILGVKVSEWGVKQMKTRWGSCNTQAKRIWLNLELGKKSPNCLEYILVHEMVHLLERKHSKRFYQLMDEFLPRWREVKQALNEPLNG